MKRLWWILVVAAIGCVCFEAYGQFEVFRYRNEANQVRDKIAEKVAMGHFGVDLSPEVTIATIARYGPGRAMVVIRINSPLMKTFVPVSLRETNGKRVAYVSDLRMQKIFGETLLEFP